MTVAEVKLWGTTIGAVSIDSGDVYCNFKYDPNFIRSGIEVSPIVMPLSDAIYTFHSLPIESFHGLPGLLSDSIPDKFGQAVINAWLAASGRTRESFDIVENLCTVGKRGMGALEFFPDKSQKRTKEDEVKIQKLVELSNDILSSRINQSYKGSQALKDLIRVGTSAGGARAKAIVAYNEETKEFVSTVSKKFGISGCCKMMEDYDSKNKVFIFTGDKRDEIREILINNYKKDDEFIKYHG